MKRIIRILVLAFTLVTGLTTVSAQTVQVIVNQKVPSLPSTLTSYLDDPFRYFNIQFLALGVGSEGLDVFFDMQFTISTSDMYVRTRPGSIPAEPLHITEGINILKTPELAPQIGNRLETNINTNNPLDIQQLPEGTYELCVDVYLWSDRTNPAREPITIGPCPTFEICYSGSAPELVSPVAGAQLDLNGNLVVSPTRKVNFFWTPVISNCSGRAVRFRYFLKVVKVLEGQNYQDAIKVNPTAFSAEVTNHNFAVFDTLRDVKVQLDRGALYVAQVEAEPFNTDRSGEVFEVANGGKSQPMPFYWVYSPAGMGGSNMNSTVNTRRHYGYSVDEEEGEEGDESEGTEGITQWEGGVEEDSELETIMYETVDQAIVGFDPKRRYMESDGYYTIPMTDDLKVIFSPARHEALKDVSYTLELYDYIDDDIDSITAYEPLHREDIEDVPERFSKPDNQELITRTLAGWGTDLEQGSLYYLQLTSTYTIDYWQYEIADTIYYVNDMVAEHIHDTISREFLEEEIAYPVGVFFQWGDDPEASTFTTPQWKAPVNRTSDDIYDPDNYKLPTSVPEVKKGKAFPVSWAPVKNVSKGDEVTYEVNVYELNSGQTPEEAISENDALVTRTLTDVSSISEEDAKFFKVFSANKTYVMTLSTSVDGESETIYHFENGNEAIPIVFKVVK
ncbi:MAG: hypothetical protein K5920_11365 [Bacteroidales bacterium]|nr:hypothetical protein [Bacteroidales bacterium]